VKGPLAGRLMTLSITCGAAPLADVKAIAAASLPRLQRLAIANAPHAEAADAAIGSLAGSAGLLELRHLYFYYAGNHASFGNDGAKALLARSDSRVAILYINPSGLSAGTRKKLEARFALYPGADWESPHLPFVSRGHLEA